MTMTCLKSTLHKLQGSKKLCSSTAAARWAGMPRFFGLCSGGLLEGRSFSEIAAAAQIAVQLLRAVRSVHQVGHIHRDIKPHSIIWLKNGLLTVMPASS